MGVAHAFAGAGMFARDVALWKFPVVLLLSAGGWIHEWFGFGAVSEGFWEVEAPGL